MTIKPENLELRDKIMSGVRKAVDKLITESAAKDETLVIADDNGIVKVVPAKELLGTLSR